MKKSLICFAAVLALVLTLPAAVFASGTGSAVSGEPSTVSDGDDGWLPVTEEILAEQEMLIAAAATDPSIVIDDEQNVSGSDVIKTDDEIIIGGDAGIAPMSTTTSNIGASRYSATSCNVSAFAVFSKTASKATCTITLQEKYNGSWRTATGLPVHSYVKIVYNKSSITAGKTFTLKSGKVYRAKIVFTDTNSSGTSYKTRYTGSF